MPRTCPHCHQQASLREAECPHCGEALPPAAPARGKRRGAASSRRNRSQAPEGHGHRRARPAKGGLGTGAIVALGAGVLAVAGLAAYVLSGGTGLPGAVKSLAGGGEIKGNEAMAIASMKVIASGEVLYREQFSEADGKAGYGDLQQLGKHLLIDRILASGTKMGYRYRVVPMRSDPGSAFIAVASPVTPGKTGVRYFAVDQQGVVCAADRPIPISPDCTVAGTPVGQ